MGWEGGEGASGGLGEGSPGLSGHNDMDEEDGGQETITMGDTKTSPGEDLIVLRTPKPSTRSRPLCQDTLLLDCKSLPCHIADMRIGLVRESFLPVEEVLGHFFL